MPIGLQYKNRQIQPGAVHFHGVVTTGGGGVIEAAATFTPGVTVVRTGVGIYTLNFNDGVTVGFSSLTVQGFQPSSGDNPLLFVLIGTPASPGEASMVLEVNDLTGTLIDPPSPGGFMYHMTRLNTSVEVQ